VIFKVTNQIIKKNNVRRFPNFVHVTELRFTY